MMKGNKFIFIILSVVSSCCIVCGVAALAIQASETTQSKKSASDYMDEYGGNPDVYARILSSTDCATLQNEFDQAEENLTLQEPGTPEYSWGLGYMKASDDRMREIGCYEVQSMPIEQIIANTAHAAQEQTRAAQPPKPLSTVTLAPAIIPVEPTNTIFIFVLQTQIAQPTIYIFQTDTPFVLATQPSTGSTCSCAGDLYNCRVEDFQTHAQAQACFDYCRSLGYGDIHKLDGNDNDGIACENLP
jgi:hypothetical protein